MASSLLVVSFLLGILVFFLLFFSLSIDRHA